MLCSVGRYGLVSESKIWGFYGFIRISICERHGERPRKTKSGRATCHTWDDRTYTQRNTQHRDIQRRRSKNEPGRRTGDAQADPQPRRTGAQCIYSGRFPEAILEIKAGTPTPDPAFFPNAKIRITALCLERYIYITVARPYGKRKISDAPVYLAYAILVCHQHPAQEVSQEA